MPSPSGHWRGHHWNAIPSIGGLSKCKICHVIRAEISVAMRSTAIKDEFRQFPYLLGKHLPYAYSHNGYWTIKAGVLGADFVGKHWGCDPQPLHGKMDFIQEIHEVAIAQTTTTI